MDEKVTLEEIEEYIKSKEAVGDKSVSLHVHKNHIKQLLSECERLGRELNSIDDLLARRPALDGEPTRCNKIMKAIDTARNADSAIIRAKELREGIRTFDNEAYEEHCMSKATSKSLKKLLKLIEEETFTGRKLKDIGEDIGDAKDEL